MSFVMGVWESFVLPTLAGISFSVIAVAYRLGQSRGIAPLDLLGLCAAAGTAVFAVLFVRSGLPLGSLPIHLWIWGILGGLGQYAAVKMLAEGLRLGPLSPLWCMLSLAFVPTLVYSAMFLGEGLRPLQYAALAASILCVISASAKPEMPGASSGRRQDLPARLLYLVLLVAILVTNSLLPIGQRVLNAGTTAQGDSNPGSGHFLLMLCYLTLMLSVALDAVLVKRTAFPRRTWLLLGLLTAAGSICGLGLLNMCASSAIVFAVQGIVSIVLVAVISVLAFRENTSASWYGTIVLGVLAVTLANWNAVADRTAISGQEPATIATCRPVQTAGSVVPSGDVEPR
jgi:hypothetical protein